MDFPKLEGACDAVVKLYEHKLKELNPTVSKIEYGIEMLYRFIDELADVAVLM